MKGLIILGFIVAALVALLSFKGQLPFGLSRITNFDFSTIASFDFLKSLPLPSKMETGEYPYRCTDGTEFSMTPSADVQQVTLYPVSNVDHIAKTTLERVKSDSGARFEYAPDGLVFFGKGESVQLIGRSFSTTCTPVSDKDNAPFNWGD